jgi:hypothetical protein
MRLLLEYGADPFMVSDNGDSALTACGGIGWVEGVTYERSARENVDAMRMLLDLGLDPNWANREGRTALMGVALKGRDDVVTMLVARGAKLETRDGGSRDGYQHLRHFRARQALDQPTASCAPACSRRSAAKPPRCKDDERGLPFATQSSSIGLRGQSVPGTHAEERQIA